MLRPSYADAFQGKMNCAVPLNVESGVSVLEGFLPYAIVHRELNNMPAYFISVPKGWQVYGAFATNWENTYAAAPLNIKVVSPSGLERVEIMPFDSNVWLYPSPGDAVGSKKWGATCAPPKSLEQIPVEKITQKYRNNISNLKVLGQWLHPLSWFQGQHHKPMPGLSSIGATVRISYADTAPYSSTKKGRSVVFEEEFECIPFCIESYGSGFTEYNWGLDLVCSIRSPNGKLENHRNLLIAIINSFQVNPQWQQTMNQTVQNIIAQRHQQQLMYQEQLLSQQREMHRVQQQYAAQRSQAITAQSEMFWQHLNVMQELSNETYAAINQTYAYQSTDDDTHHKQYIDFIHDVETYQDPHYGEVKLDMNYSNNWHDGQGNWIQTNDDLYDPNLDSDVSAHSWKRGKRIY